jgi:hypothetical protein
MRTPVGDEQHDLRPTVGLDPDGLAAEVGAADLGSRQTYGSIAIGILERR